MEAGGEEGRRLVKKKKKKAININGSGGSPAGDPRHDPFKQDKRVDPFMTQTR
jgi:hypothetical protein